MFNTTHRHYNRSESRIVHGDQEITEIKAPTDESIRLLNEFQEKALQNIIARIPLPENMMQGELYIIDEPTRMSQRIIVQFMLNGEKYKAEKTLGIGEMYKATREELWSWGDNHKYSIITDFVIKEISKAIAEQVVHASYEQVEKIK